MTKKRQPNWVISNIKNIVLVISLYPWALLLITMMAGSGGPSSGAMAAGLMGVLLFIVMSIANLIISLVVIVIADLSTSSLPMRYGAYFCAMNSISALAHPPGLQLLIFLPVRATGCSIFHRPDAASQGASRPAKISARPLRRSVRVTMAWESTCSSA